MATATKDVSLNKKVSQFFWRSWAIQASWNYERQMNMGFLYGMVPTLDRLYPDESDPKQLAAKKEAYHRHMAFYNCTPQTSAFILGLTASMEEEYAKDPENFDPDSINAVKTSLMGPLSGIGDSFFQGTIRVIAFGLGVQLAQQGSIMGPILAMLISIVPSVLITWFAAKMGYQGGHEYLSKLQGGDLMLAEESAIGLSHTEAGYVLADHWGLPIDIVEPIRFHHKPELATDAKEATAIVAIAEVMARTPGDNVEAWRDAIQSLAAPMKELGIDVENAEAIFQDYHNLRESCLKEPMF